MQRLRSFAVLPLVVFALASALAACGPEAEAPPATASPTLQATAEPTPEPTPTAKPTAEATLAATATATPEATPKPAPTQEATPAAPTFAQAFQGVRGIVDPTNFGWPREVEGLNGVVSIPFKPLRIITASVGHDEMTLAIVPLDRLVAVGTSSKNPTYSNVAELLQEKTEISRDPETIISQEPDIIVTSPFFSADGVSALSKIGIPVIQTELKQGPEARINSILLMGYIFGEEERAIAFATEVRERYEALIAVTGNVERQPRVLALTQFGDQIWTAGKDSTEGAVITAAGGLNAAAEAGIERQPDHQPGRCDRHEPRGHCDRPTPSSSAPRSSERACWTMRRWPSFPPSRTRPSTWLRANTSPPSPTGTSGGRRILLESSGQTTSATPRARHSACPGSGR